MLSKKTPCCTYNNQNYDYIVFFLSYHFLQMVDGHDLLDMDKMVEIDLLIEFNEKWKTIRSHPVRNVH